MQATLRGGRNPKVSTAAPVTKEGAAIVDEFAALPKKVVPSHFRKKLTSSHTVVPNRSFSEEQTLP